MNNLLISIFFLLLLPSALFAEVHRAVQSVDQVREKDSKRQYDIYIDTLVVGQFESEYKGQTRFQGVEAFRFDENLDLDFSGLGQTYKINIINQHYVDQANKYIGSDMSILANEQNSKLYVLNGKEYLDGYSIRGEFEDDILIPLGGDKVAADNNMIDQYELFLAFHDFKVGDTIIDSLFIPQNVYLSPVECVIEDFQWTRYDQYADSAFVCHFSRPVDMTVYLTKANKVIRVDQAGQNFRIFLKESPFERLQAGKKDTSLTLDDFIKRLPIYLIFVAIGILMSLPFIKENYRKTHISIALICGFAAFVLVQLIQVPILQWYSTQYIIPGIQSGGSFYTLAILPSIIKAIITQMLLLAPVFLIIRWKKLRQSDSIMTGIFLGIGFAVLEACYFSGEPFQKGAFEVLSLAMIFRIAMMIFAATASAGYGYGINRGRRYIVIIAAIMLLVQFLNSYMIAFVQTKVIDTSLMQIFGILLILLSLFVIFAMIKMARVNMSTRNK